MCNSTAVYKASKDAVYGYRGVFSFCVAEHVYLCSGCVPTGNSSRCLLSLLVRPGGRDLWWTARSGPIPLRRVLFWMQLINSFFYLKQCLPSTCIGNEVSAMPSYGFCLRRNKEYFQMRMTTQGLTKTFPEPSTFSSTVAGSLCSRKTCKFWIRCGAAVK